MKVPVVVVVQVGGPLSLLQQNKFSQCLSTFIIHVYINIYIYIIIYTSSTAQGGGGSFKNRKPIGDVGCCESRMAERIH